MDPFFVMALVGFFGVKLLVWLMRLLEVVVEDWPVSPAPRAGEFKTRWVFDDEELIIRKRR